jgi:hypothetical protein
MVLNFFQKKANVSFSQIITIFGMIAIILGIMFFYFYAVANEWIGESIQIVIGIFVAFFLFGIGYQLREKAKNWSYIVIGGSFFIHYLTISVAVYSYQIMSAYLAFPLALIFVISSMLLSVQLNSRVIAYFSVFGGFIVPFITNSLNLNLFLMTYVLLLCLALLYISFHKNWQDLRFVSFIISHMLISSPIFNFENFDLYLMSLLFILLFYIIFFVSAIIPHLKKEKLSIVLDSILLVFQVNFLLPILYTILNTYLNIGVKFFGLFLIIFSFVYLIPLIYFKKKVSNYNVVLDYVFLGLFFLLINLGVIFLLESFSLEYYILYFILIWIILTLIRPYFSNDLLIRIVSYFFLYLIFIWFWFILRFDKGLLHASIFMVFLILISISSYYFRIKNIDKKFYSIFFIIWTYIIIFSFSKYLVFFISELFLISIIVSFLWLVYTLLIYSLSKDKIQRIISYVLFGITIFKIAIEDLFYLEGIYRIIAFIIFGILLLLAGLFFGRKK